MRGYFLLSLERFVVKSKVLILERRREIRRSVFKRVKTQIGLPLFNGRIHKHLFTSLKNLGDESENPSLRSTPCALKNAPQSKFGVIWLAWLTLTTALRLSGSY